MTEDEFNLPDGRRVKLAFLHRWNGQEIHPLDYLHSKRSKAGQIFSNSVARLRQCYQVSLTEYAQAFADWARDKMSDAIVAVPSSERDVEPYRDAVAGACPRARDLSNSFTKRNDYRAMTDQGGVEAAKRAIFLTENLDCRTIKSVIIIDDIISSGKSAAAVLHHISEAGLSPNAEVWIAAALKTPRG